MNLEWFLGTNEPFRPFSNYIYHVQQDLWKNKKKLRYPPFNDNLQNEIGWLVVGQVVVSRARLCKRATGSSGATGAICCNLQFQQFKIKSLTSSDEKVKVKVPICEKIEGRSVMQHLLLVQIPLKIGNDAGVRPNIRRNRSRAASADCVLPHHI